MEEAVAAQAAVQQALTVLRDFYAKAGQATAFVQRKKQQPEAPEIFSSPYRGMGGESGGTESSKTYPYPRGLAGQENADFLGLRGPSYRKTHRKRWGAKPPPFPVSFAVGGIAWTPTVDDLRPDNIIAQPKQGRTLWEGFIF